MLDRSRADVPSDKLVDYLVPSVGCAMANYIGNHYSDVGAALALILVGVYVYMVLKWPPASLIDKVMGRGDGKGGGKGDGGGGR